MRKIQCGQNFFLSKYCSHQRGQSLDPNKLPCSSNWTAIKVGFPIFKQGICWNVGNKLGLSFWESNWVKGNTVRDLIKGSLIQHEEFRTVAKMHQNGTWKWEKISFKLLRQVVDRIQALHIQAFGEKDDSLMWKLSPDGEFSMASAYLLAIAELPKPPPFTDCWIWRMDTLPKIKHFFWLCNHGSIPMRQVIKARGINCNGICPLCFVQEETILHVLRDCPTAKNFWLSMGVP